MYPLIYIHTQEAHVFAYINSMHLRKGAARVQCYFLRGCVVTHGTYLKLPEW